jgi:putative transposase
METQGRYLTPFQKKLLQKNLQTSLRDEYRRRIEIMLLADEGQSQRQICQALSCSKETARYWIAKAQAGQAHNWQDSPRGRPKTVNKQYIKRLRELVSKSPREYGYSFERWTAQWLSKQLDKDLGIEVSARHINRLLVQMDLSLRSISSADSSVTDEKNPNNSPLLIRDLSSVSISNLSALEHFNRIR